MYFDVVEDIVYCLQLVCGVGVGVVDDVQYDVGFVDFFQCGVECFDELVWQVVDEVDCIGQCVYMIVFCF